MKNKIVEDIRSFNRFYTAVLGLLDHYLDQSTYTLPEVRILFELYHQRSLTASELIDSLAIDKGYLSRMLKKFEKKKLITRKRERADNRIVFLSLTPYGKSEFEVLNLASHNQIATMIENLTREEKDTLVASMNKIKKLLAH